MKLLLIVLGALAAAFGQPGVRPGEFQGCTESVALQTLLRPGADTVPVPGFNIRVDSSASRIVKNRSGGANCQGQTQSPIPTFAWALDVPAGSATKIKDPRQRAIEFVPDRPGAYVVRFTACPRPCSVRVISAFTPTKKPIITVEEVGPVTKTLTVQVVDTFQVPPEFVPPRLPSSRAPGTTTLVPATTPQAYDRQKGLCPGSIGLFLLQENQWMATAFNTPRFDLAEGIVYTAHISSADDIRNHEKMDAVAYLDVDPPFRNLLARGINSEDDKDPSRPFGGLEVEWEYDLWKEPMRPLIGDRMSVLGYHILDCDHEKKSEIHPPIAMAVHRPRAIRLPSTMPEFPGNPPFREIGQNVVVPGIITDIWANLDGGQALDCDSTGLGIPLDPPREVAGPGGGTIKIFTKCGVQPDPPSAPFVFHIYLPPSPRQLLSEVGVNKNINAPLFVSIENHPAQASLGARGDLPVTIIERVLDGPMPYLTVQVGLSGLPKGGRFAKRIVAAWVYPELAGTNYGVRSFSVKLNSLLVTGDGEEAGNDGDWRFWVSVPSIAKPWTHLLDCDGCVDDDKTYTPSSSLWKSGALAAGGVVANDVLLFRGRSGLITTAGFEEDLVWNDAIGNGSGTFMGAFPVRVTASKYVANFEGLANPPLPPAAISPQLASHTNQLKVGVTPAIQTRLDVLSARALEFERLQKDWTTASVNRIRKLEPRDTLFSKTGLRSPISRSRAEDQEAFVTAIRKHALRRLGPNPDPARRQKIARELREIRDQIPAPLYKKHLCEIETGQPCP